MRRIINWFKNLFSPDPVEFSGVIPPPDPPNVPDELEIELICPLCNTHWANAHVEFGKKMDSKHYSPREDLIDRVRFQKNGLPICPSCGFEYTAKAMEGTMVLTVLRKDRERSVWKRGERREKEDT